MVIKKKKQKKIKTFMQLYENSVPTHTYIIFTYGS